MSKRKLDTINYKNSSSKRARFDISDKSIKNNTCNNTSNNTSKDKVNTEKTWVAATHTFNYMSNDCLVDVLSKKPQRGTRTTPCYHTTHKPENPNDFSAYLKRQGIIFENGIVKCLKEKKINITTVSPLFSKEAYSETKRLMKQGVFVIHSGSVWNRKENIGGVADLIVRSDKLGLIVSQNPLDKSTRTIKAPKLKGKYHYVVIDIKFSSIPLRADMTHILNSDHYPAYKTQTWIYTNAIGKMQGYTSRYSFILGRRWKCQSSQTMGTNSLEKLGVIDYKGIDSEYVQKSLDAIDWVRKVQKDGDDLIVIPPSNKLLYPNMCIDSGIWNEEKRKIAERIGEISTIWYCGSKQRDNALEHGISSWKDDRCNATALGISGTRANTINQIISVNRGDTKCNILPSKIETEMYNWRETVEEAYVDFETISDIVQDFTTLPLQTGEGYIFMIGISWVENKTCKYKNFICESLSRGDEQMVCTEFTDFILEKGFKKLWYWYAEKMFWNKAILSQRVENRIDDSMWCDLSKIFKEEPIVIKGCFKFGLKEVAKAMRNFGMIKCKDTSSTGNGMNAMIKAKNHYNQGYGKDSVIMRDLSTYNKFDCVVLYEILDYLRKNM